MWRIGEKPEASLPPLLLFVSQYKTYGLPYTFTYYLMLVDWTDRSIRADKRAIFQRILFPSWRGWGWMGFAG